jgi:hypothetical protein
MANSTIYRSGTILKNLINDNWTLSKKPQVDFIWDEKSVGFMDDREDSILITSTNENTRYFGLYGRDFYHTISFRIDSYTYQNFEYHENFVNEIFRILKESIRSDDYVVLLITGSNHENDSYRNIYKHVITVDIQQFNP